MLQLNTFLHWIFGSLGYISGSRLLLQSCSPLNLVSIGSRISLIGYVELKIWPIYWDLSCANAILFCALKLNDTRWLGQNVQNESCSGLRVVVAVKISGVQVKNWESYACLKMRGKTVQFWECWIMRLIWWIALNPNFEHVRSCSRKSLQLEKCSLMSHRATCQFSDSRD